MHTGLENAVSDTFLDRFCASEGFRPAETIPGLELRLMKYGRTYQIISSFGIVATVLLGALMVFAGMSLVTKANGQLTADLGAGVFVFLMGAAFEAYAFFGIRELFFTDVFLSPEGIHRRRNKAVRPLALRWEQVRRITFAPLDHALVFHGAAVGSFKISKFRRGFSEMLLLALEKLPSESQATLVRLVETNGKLIMHRFFTEDSSENTVE